LGRPHRVRGTVVAGDRRGSTIGFPTANLADIPVIVPAAGVYAGRVLLDGTSYPAACNIGSNPTFDVGQTKVEVHILGFSGDLYGTAIEVDLLGRIRDVRKFASANARRGQLTEDVAKACEIANAYHQPHGCDLGQ